jgi:hypothetical protein
MAALRKYLTIILYRSQQILEPWRVTVNIVNKQSWAGDKEFSGMRFMYRPGVPTP